MIVILKYLTTSEIKKNAHNSVTCASLLRRSDFLFFCDVTAGRKTQFVGGLHMQMRGGGDLLVFIGSVN